MHFLYRTYPPHPAALRRCRQLNFHVTSATHKCLSITIFFSGQVLGPAVLEFRISQLRAAKHCRSCSLSEADAGCAALSSSSPSLTTHPMSTLHHNFAIFPSVQPPSDGLPSWVLRQSDASR